MRVVEHVEPEETVGHDAVERFIVQPPGHDVGDEADAHDEVESPGIVVHRSFTQRLRHFLFEKKPGEYSSIAPRTPDGRRSGPFFYNGSGLGR